MTSHSFCRSIVLSIPCLLALAAPAARAQEPQPGDIFREYKWRPRTNWQRCTGPDASMSGAKAFLPNPVNRITIGDLQGATRVEVMIEKLTSHGGTMNPRVSINNNKWLQIPEAKGIPSNRGVGGTASMYLTMQYPVVRIPLSQVKQGTNTFEFVCEGKGGWDLGRVWPQFLIYGVTFRVYYGASKPHPTGRIKSPRAGATLGDNPTFEVEASSKNGIKSVDVIGDYNDFNWRGDGLDRQWQYRSFYGAIRSHIGSATRAPYRVRWDTTWIPTQPAPFRVMARIVDTTGMVTMTPAVPVELIRRKTVIRFQNTKLPRKWQSQYYTPTQFCESVVRADLSKAEEARLWITTWNGVGADEISLNGRRMTPNTGKNHDLSYDVIKIPVSAVKNGVNTLRTRSNSKHHGIEVQWPGPEIFMRFDVPERAASFTPFGKGCSGSAGIPAIGSSGKAIAGRTFQVTLAGAKANTPVVLLGGFSNQSWGQVQLPLDFTAAGANGCKALVALDTLALFSSDASGRVTVPLPLPNDKRLWATKIYQQWAVIDGSNRFGGVFSNAARVVISNR